MIRSILACAALLLLTTSAGHASDPELVEQQKIACLGDAVRLCGDAWPDLADVKACMRDKKKLVSPACAAFYPSSKR